MVHCSKERVGLMRYNYLRGSQSIYFIRMIMNLTPLHNKVVVERIAGLKSTASGIVLQRTEEVDRAKVLSVGPDVDEVSVGDVVLLDWNKAIKSGELYIVTVDNIVFVYGE